MEDNSINLSVASKGITTTKKSAEESGWTAYFEDLSNNNDIRQRKSNSSSFSCGSSLISDAATTARKISDDSHRAFACSSAFAGSSKVPNKSSFKKTRTKEICEDDSLEDTASSPVSSPKVKEITASENYSEIQIEEQEEGEKKMKFDHKIKNNDCRELKKRGLCLVPLSMYVYYFG